MSLTQRIARAQLCVGALFCVLLLPLWWLLPQWLGVYRSAVLGVVSCVLPVWLIAQLTARSVTPSASGMIVASLGKLFGAGALLGLSLAFTRDGSRGALSEVVLMAFLVSAVSQPVITAMVATRSEPSRRSGRRLV